jgi:hypothetical protein
MSPAGPQGTSANHSIPVFASQGQLLKKVPSHAADICGDSAAPAIKGGWSKSNSGPVLVKETALSGAQDVVKYRCCNQASR